MKTVSLTLLIGFSFTGAYAQITLTGTSYTQDFNAIDSGLPSGWTVSMSATSSSLGTPATFKSDRTSWSSTADGLDFRNIASDNIATNASSSTQNEDTNRALGWRPTSAPARDGAMTLSISNTSDYNNFALSLRLFTANNVTNIQTYAVEYRIGDSGAFTQLGTAYTTAVPFSASTYSFNSITLSAINDQSSPVYIRIRGTAGAGGGSGNLDTIGLDDFTLTYSSTSAIPEPSTYAALLGMLALGGAVVHRQRRARQNPA